MSNVVVNIFKVPELRRRILFTLAILVIYRIGAHIPIPGINVDALKAYFDQAAKSQGGGLMDFFDLFAGGALKRFTIFAKGLKGRKRSTSIQGMERFCFVRFSQWG